MSHLQVQEELIIGGGFADNSGAMGVFLTEDIEQARNFVSAAPVVQNKIITVEVHPWVVTVPGCIDMEGL